MQPVNKTSSLFIMLMLAFMATNCFANEAQEKIYLTQILNQLNAIQPFIIAAEKEQPKNTRIQFHYTKFHDSQGQLHNGLLEDIQSIKAGIEEKLNQIPVEPRTAIPISGDYLPSSGDNK